MNRSISQEVKVGIFVALGLLLSMITLLILGGGSSIFSKGLTFHTRVSQIEGLIEGGNVKISGIKVGQVTAIGFEDNSTDVRVTFSVAEKYKDVIRQNASITIQTQGMLGDKYIMIHPGTTDAEVAKSGSEIKSEPPKEIKDYLNDADAVVSRLKSSLGHVDQILSSFEREKRSEQFFKNMASLSGKLNDSTKLANDSMTRLHSIISKVDSGEGTLGALINDPSLYEDMRNLIGGVNRNRVFKYVVRKSVESSREARENEENAKK